MEFLELAGETLINLDLFPIFDVAHYIVCATVVRKHISSKDAKNVLFSAKYPLASWFAFLLMTFSGGVISNCLIGKDPIGFLENHRNVLIATLVWYLIMFSPGDVALFLVDNFVTRLPIALAKEVFRLHRIIHGVQLGVLHYPSGPLVWLLLGCTLSNGSAFIIHLLRLVYGNWAASSIYKFSTTTTKAVLLVSVILTLSKLNLFVQFAPKSIIIFTCYTVLVATKLFTLTFDQSDPFSFFDRPMRIVFPEKSAPPVICAAFSTSSPSFSTSTNSKQTGKSNKKNE